MIHLSRSDCGAFSLCLSEHFVIIWLSIIGFARGLCGFALITLKDEYYELQLWSRPICQGTLLSRQFKFSQSQFIHLLSVSGPLRLVNLRL